MWGFSENDGDLERWLGECSCLIWGIRYPYNIEPSGEPTIPTPLFWQKRDSLVLSEDGLCGYEYRLFFEN
jgi:hypothetical protein